MKAAVYLASYKGTHSGLAGLINVGIRTLDKAQYSHSEICIGNPFDGEAECFSSSGIDGGVRMKQMQLSPDKWDVLHLHWVPVQQVRDHFGVRKEESAGYDYWGTGRFASPLLLREHPTRDFCSEFCGAAIGLHEAWRVSPQGLHCIALSMGAIQI